MEWALAYLLLGVAAGFLGGLFGIGGGTILVPVLYWLFTAQDLLPGQTMHLALGTSMATIIFTSLSSLRRHHLHAAVNWMVVRRITPGILFGTALGAISIANISAGLLMVFFTGFVYFAAIQILLDSKPQAARPLPGPIGLGAFGAFTGWLSSLVSIGGGTLVIPFLVWCNLPLRHALGTAAAIGLPVAAGGTLGYILTGLRAGIPLGPSLGFVYLPALLWVALASVLTAPLGASTTHRMDVSLLRKLFALLLVALATRMLLKALD